MIKGNVYYNCDITEEETWEETLKRLNLRILQIVMIMGNVVTVNLMANVNGVLITREGKGTEKEIETIIANLKEERNEL